MSDDSNEYSLFDDATETELYVGYITFGLNIIFFILLLAWFINKCFCASRDKPIMDYLNFLKRQNQETEKLELARNMRDEEKQRYPAIRIERSESEKIAAAGFSKDENVTPSHPADMVTP